MEHTGRYYEPLFHTLAKANLFVTAINPKLKDFGDNSLRKVKSDKADAAKFARYALDRWTGLKQYSLMDELRNQLKIMNRQFNFYMKHKTAMKNNLIGILDQTYPGVNSYIVLNETASKLPEYPVVMAMKGVGTSLGPHLMAEIGDVTRFTHKGAITAFAGVGPGVNQSGTYQQKSVHASKRGSGTLRKTLFQVMDVLIKIKPQDDP